MRIECIPVFVAKHKDHAKQNNGISRMHMTEEIPADELQWRVPGVYPTKEWPTLEYHFEIRKVNKKLKDGEKDYNPVVLFKTETKQFEYKEGKEEYISWGDIPFRFEHKSMSVYIDTNQVKI